MIILFSTILLYFSVKSATQELTYPDSSYGQSQHGYSSHFSDRLEFDNISLPRNDYAQHMDYYHHYYQNAPPLHQNRFVHGLPMDKMSGYYSGHGAEVFVPTGGKGKKKKKNKFFKRNKFFLPLLITVVAKIVHFLPVAKLTLLALFILVLFAKKAFLISVGSLLLVLYDHFYKNGSSNVLYQRDRVHGISEQLPGKQGFSLEGDQKINSDNWWGRVERNYSQKINPRDEEKWTRWWAPQISNKKEIPEHIKERIVKKFETLFPT